MSVFWLHFWPNYWFYFMHLQKHALCYSHTNSYMCVWGGGLFCTLDILGCHPFIAVHSFFASWMIYRLYTHKKISVFLYFSILPIHFQWRSFLTANNTSVTILFSDHLAFSNQVHDYFWFIFLWSYSDCHKSHQVVIKVVSFRWSSDFYIFFSGLKWPNNT